MNRRVFNKLVASVGAGVTFDGFAWAANSSAKNKKPNILFIITDQQHAKMMSCAGNKCLKTPAMDSLARDGMRFEKAYCSNPVCVPSRTSMATGVMSCRLGAHDNRAGMRIEQLPETVDRNSLGKIMKRAGYATFYGGKVHMCNALTPKQAGYDTYLVLKYKDKLKGQFESDVLPFTLEGNPDAQHSVNCDKRDDTFKENIPSGYRIFDNGAVKIKQYQDNPEFAAMVESMDESFGRVLDKLKALDIEDTTVVIFYSDNGGMSAANFYRPDRRIAKDKLDKAFSTSNLPLRGAKGWLYEGGIRVPLIIKVPGKGLKGTVCDVPVTSPDFFPTILEMAGIESGVQKKDGMSIVPLVTGENNINREAIFWHFPHYSNHGMQSPGGAIRFGDYKLLEYYENNTVQLFDLKEDINEKTDLAAKHPERVEQLRKMLHDWQKRTGAKMMKPNPDWMSFYTPPHGTSNPAAGS